MEGRAKCHWCVSGLGCLCVPLCVRACRGCGLWRVLLLGPLLVLSLPSFVRGLSAALLVFCVGCCVLLGTSSGVCVRGGVPRCVALCDDAPSRSLLWLWSRVPGSVARAGALFEVVLPELVANSLAAMSCSPGGGAAEGIAARRRGCVPPVSPPVGSFPWWDPGIGSGACWLAGGGGGVVARVPRGRGLGACRCVSSSVVWGVLLVCFFRGVWFMALVWFLVVVVIGPGEWGGLGKLW